MWPFPVVVSFNLKYYTIRHWWLVKPSGLGWSPSTETQDQLEESRIIKGVKQTLHSSFIIFILEKCCHGSYDSEG